MFDKVKATIIRTGMPYITTAYVAAESGRNAAMQRYRTLIRYKDGLIAITEWPKVRKGHELRTGTIVPSDLLRQIVDALPKKGLQLAAAPPAGGECISGDAAAYVAALFKCG